MQHLELRYSLSLKHKSQLLVLLMDGVNQLAGDHVYGHLPFLGGIAPVATVESVLLLVALLVLPDLHGRRVHLPPLRRRERRRVRDRLDFDVRVERDTSLLGLARGRAVAARVGKGVIVGRRAGGRERIVVPDQAWRHPIAEPGEAQEPGSTAPLLDGGKPRRKVVEVIEGVTAEGIVLLAQSVVVTLERLIDGDVLGEELVRRLRSLGLGDVRGVLLLCW